VLAETPDAAPERAAGLTVAGFLDLETAGPATAVPLLEEGQELARATDQPFTAPLATQYLGLANMFCGNLPEADRLLRRAAELHGHLDPHYAAFCLADVGITAVLARSLDAAGEAFTACLRHNEAATPGPDPLRSGAPASCTCCATRRSRRPSTARRPCGSCAESMTAAASPGASTPWPGQPPHGATCRAPPPWRAQLTPSGARSPARPPGPVLLFRERFVEPARRSLGAKRWSARHIEGAALDRGSAVLLALGEHTPTPTVRHPNSVLTKRQHEVAVLIADGLTDREIAERLVISPRTAESHVEQILTRLNLRSRTQVAAWAVRNDQR